MTTQDPELSAALGWPGGISDPVLDRKTLLQMVAALRLASQQALEALEYENSWHESFKVRPYVSTIDAVAALRAALAQQAEPVQVAERERIASQWEGCVTHQLDTFGPVDIGASIRAGELVEAQEQADPTDPGRDVDVLREHVRHLERRVRQLAREQAEPTGKQNLQVEPVQEPVAWDVTKDGRLIYDYDFTHDVVLRVMGDFENDEQRVRYAKRIVDKLNAAPAQQAEPVAWECKAGGLKRLTQRLYDAQTVATKRHYTRIAPPQRSMVPLTEGEIYLATGHCGVSEHTAIKIARAVEEASWEKNHGQA